MTRRAEFLIGVMFLAWGAMALLHVLSEAASNMRGTVRVFEQIEAGR